MFVQEIRMLSVCLRNRAGVFLVLHVIRLLLFCSWSKAGVQGIGLLLVCYGIRLLFVCLRKKANICLFQK